MDVVCKAVTTDMDTWSAFAVGPHLSSAKIALLGGISSQKAPIDSPNFFWKGGRDVNPCPIPSWILVDQWYCDSASSSK